MLTTVTKRIEQKVNEMLVVGLVSSEEEQSEIRLIAQIWMVRQRVRYLANKSSNEPCQPQHKTVQETLK